MKRIITSLLIVSFLISSCTHSFNITKYETNLEFYKKVNNMCDGINEIILRTTDGKELKVYNFTMMPDSSQYINLLNNKTEFVNTNLLKEMEYKETAWGVIDGIGLGCLSGLVAGTLIYLCFFRSGDAYAGLVWAFVASISSIVVLITGGIWGGIHQSTIVLNLQQHQNSKEK